MVLPVFHDVPCISCRYGRGPPDSPRVERAHRAVRVRQEVPLQTISLPGGIRTSGNYWGFTRLMLFISVKYIFNLNHLNLNSAKVSFLGCVIHHGSASGCEGSSHNVIVEFLRNPQPPTAYTMRYVMGKKKKCSFS